MTQRLLPSLHKPWLTCKLEVMTVAHALTFENFLVSVQKLLSLKTVCNQSLFPYTDLLDAQTLPHHAWLCL